jgi:protein-disulfide isomerase
MVIGGVVVLGVVLLGALLALSLGGESEPAADAGGTGGLVSYCEANPDRCIVKGDENAPVTMVAIEDFACSHCRDFHLSTHGELVSEYVDTGQVRYIALPYALRPETLPSASASMCAAEQDAYFEYSLAVYQEFGSNGYLSPEYLSSTAGEIGLDVAAFDECFNSRRYEETIAQNQIAAAESGVSGTPNFFIDGYQLAGNYPYAEFERQIQIALNSN